MSVSSFASASSVMLVKMFVLSLVVASTSISAQTYDTSVQSNVGVDMLVTVKRTIRGTVTVIEGEGKTAKKTKVRVNVVEAMEAIDHLTKVEGEDLAEGRRRYLRDHSTRNGRICDSARGGMEFQYAASSEGVGLEARGDRLVPEPLGDNEASRVHGLTGWLPLPDGVKVGDRETDVDMGIMMSDLFGLDDYPDNALADVKLETIDAEKNQAVFVGLFGAPIVVRTDTESWPARCRGKVEIVVDLKSRRLCSIDVTGKATIAKENFSGKLDVSATWRAETGAKVVAARRKKITYRDVPRDVKKFGLGFLLPSHFHDFGADGPLGGEIEELKGSHLFVSDVYGEDNMVMVAVKATPVSKRLSKFVRKLLEALIARQPGAKATKIRTALGRGQSVVYPDDEGHFGLQDVIPGKKEVLPRVVFQEPSGGVLLDGLSVLENLSLE